VTAEPSREREIRQHAHRLAAEGIEAGLNMWELERYYPEQADQDVLETELLRIARRLRRQGVQR
jgi:hypothetical protein